MFIKHNLVYFGFPKCASELIRKSLKLKWITHDNSAPWDACSVNYCHVRPIRFITRYNVTSKDITLFTVVRNTYERLVSLWTFWTMKKMNPYKTFEEFIYTIYENRDNLEKLPMCWMFMPFEKYFEGVLDRLMIFQMTELEKVENLLSRYGVSLDTSKKVNTSKHDHYSTYYTSEMERMIYEVYKYEIDRFGYVFERIF